VNKLMRQLASRSGVLTALVLIALQSVPVAGSAQEIMLERVGAVRLAQPGDLERDDAWLQKAFRNQARVASAQPVRVSSASRADDAAASR
jgi:hypothetical protein